MKRMSYTLNTRISTNSISSKREAMDVLIEFNSMESFQYIYVYIYLHISQTYQVSMDLFISQNGQLDCTDGERPCGSCRWNVPYLTLLCFV